MKNFYIEGVIEKEEFPKILRFHEKVNFNFISF